MDNLNTYNNVFFATFGVSESLLKTLKLKESEQWDSVGHISLIAAIEEAFDINMDSEDIFAITSYEEGLVILHNKYNINF